MGFVQAQDTTLVDLQDHLGYRNYSEVATLTEDENWAIMSYGFTDEVDYQDINGFLRFGVNYDLYNQSVSSVTKLIEHIKSAADKLPRMPKNLITYRGLKLKWREDRCFIKGEVLQDPAFLSTTLKLSTARHFAFYKQSGKGALLTISLSNEKRGILISENNENEVLFMPNTSLTITSSFIKNGECYAFAHLD